MKKKATKKNGARIMKKEIKCETIEEFIARGKSIKLIQPVEIKGSLNSRYNRYESNNTNGISLKDAPLNKRAFKSKAMFVRFLNRFGSGTRNHQETER